MGLLSGFDLAPGLQQSKKAANLAMQNTKSNTLDPLDVTTSTLDKGVALVNPNDTSVTGQISNYKTSIVEQLNGIVGALAGGLLNPKVLSKMIKLDGNRVKFDTDDLITTAAGILGYNVSGKAGVMQGIADGITDEFSRLTGLNVSGILVTDGKTFRASPDWRSQAGMATLDLVRQFTGIDEFLDASVQSSLYNSILYSVSNYGMKDSYKDLWDNYPYVPFRQDAFIQAIQVMITKGDIESVDVVVGMLDTEGRNTLLNKYPDFIEVLFEKFSFDPAMPPEEYPTLRDKVLNILKIVIGPEWWYRNTQFGRAYNLGIVNRISDDMVTLLSTVDALVPLLCCRTMFSEGSAVDYLNTSFEDPPIQLR